MRISERLMYLLGIALAITYGLEEFLWSFILVCLILIVIIVGAAFEGLRFFQWIFIIAFIGQIILVIMDVFSLIALAIYCTFLGIAILCSIIFGEANFNRVSMTGPFEVGHKDIFCSKDGRAISVWYPMDREEHKKTIKEKGRNTYYFRYGYSSRVGLTKATASWGTDDHVNPWFFKYIDDVKMDTCQDGKLSKVFNERELVPMIYCHGLTANRVTQSVSCRDFASHGFLVFSIDHFDGTANYARKQNGEEKYWSSNHDLLDKKLR